MSEAFDLIYYRLVAVIREVTLSRNWMTKDLAEQAGINKNTAGKIISSSESKVAFSSLLKACEVLSIDPIAEIAKLRKKSRGANPDYEYFKKFLIDFEKLKEPTRSMLLDTFHKIVKGHKSIERS